MNCDHIFKKLESITNLPTLPTVVVEIGRLLEDLDAPIEPLVELLEKDQAISLKILKLVNSSFYGFKSEVSSLRHAVTLMGYNTISNAVLTVSVMDTLSLKNKLRGFEIDMFWKHTIHAAVMSKFLANKTNLVSEETAFTGGLLHDIGKVVLVNYFPQEVLAVVEESHLKGSTFFQAENTLDACGHALVGSYLARQWQLPEELISAINLHHTPPKTDSEHSALISIIGLADTLVHMLVGDKGYSLALEKYPESVRAPFADIFAEGSKWYAQVKKDMEAACSFFDKA